MVLSPHIHIIFNELNDLRIFNDHIIFTFQDIAII